MEIRDASVLVQGNGVFSSSATGVIISVTDVQYLPDLGGGAEGSIGGNEFSCKNSDDLRVSIPDGAVLFAQDNYWDPSRWTMIYRFHQARLIPTVLHQISVHAYNAVLTCHFIKTRRP